MSSSGASQHESCEPCEFGSFSSIDGASACICCEPGSFSPSLGATECLLCPPGFYLQASNVSSQDATACLACSSGKYLSSSGASQLESCKPCELGTYSTGMGLSACLPSSAHQLAVMEVWISVSILVLVIACSFEWWCGFPVSRALNGNVVELYGALFKAVDCEGVRQPPPSPQPPPPQQSVSLPGEYVSGSLLQGPVIIFSEIPHPRLILGNNRSGGGGGRSEGGGSRGGGGDWSGHGASSDFQQRISPYPKLILGNNRVRCGAGGGGDGGGVGGVGGSGSLLQGPVTIFSEIPHPRLILGNNRSGGGGGRSGGGGSRGGGGAWSGQGASADFQQHISPYPKLILGNNRGRGGAGGGGDGGGVGGVGGSGRDDAADGIWLHDALFTSNSRRPPRLILGNNQGSAGDGVTYVIRSEDGASPVGGEREFGGPPSSQARLSPFLRRSPSSHRSQPTPVASPLRWGS